MQRCLLYFNLPFKEIIKEEIRPYLLFSQDLSNPGKASNFLNEMLNKFEKEKDDKIRLANIILLKVPNSSSDFINSNRDRGMNKDDDHFQIIGGYASDGWAASQELLGNGGDESCFIFNLTQNLRFKAVKGRGPFQVTDTQSDQKMNRRILFGKNGALVIENDFKRITSKIGDPQDPNTEFMFGDELMQKNKVDSIIPGKQFEIEQPVMVEVWSFSIKA